MANTLVNHSVDNTRISYETMLLLEAIVAAVIGKTSCLLTHLKLAEQPFCSEKYTHR